MSGDNSGIDGRISLFLNERFMGATCVFVVAASLVCLYLGVRQGSAFSAFEALVKLITAAAMFLAFTHYKWDVAKGLVGGALFCLMYQEGYLALAKLWSEQDFDTYLVVGLQGSVYLAAAGMSFLMTIIITINHFFISYASKGNPKNVILNRMAIIFKIVLYAMLLAANSMLGFESALLWQNALQYLADIALLLLIVSVESQFDDFKVLREELLALKREEGLGR